MSEPTQCEICGGPLEGGRCPHCRRRALDPQRTMTVADTLPYNPSVPQPTATTIGRYKIVRVIGEGGMGTVYEAEQDNPHRTVALKVIKPGMASPNLLRRFEQETQALGRLQHPGIAQIYEAGTADTGYGPQPYFAMEFIRGRTLRDYADENHLSTPQRLEIMAKVCDAVHHAHQRGLIHRDLKPGNILVDENAQPKILDFGVARVTDRDSQATSQTDVGQLIGTLAYMSPEQVLADPLELDIRSDVYALGVILYELLAAKLPYTIGNKLHEALHAIREEDPAKLSSVNHAYKGDIETIAAKALEKDKTRRYSSAAELAADIRHCLADEPIVARPPTLSYQLQKFARRHKALVVGIAAVFVVLIGGIVASTWQAVRANRERDRATAAEQKANQSRDRATLAEQISIQERDRAVASDAQAKKERDLAVEQKKRADTEAATATAVSTFWQQNLVAQASDGALSMRAALDRAASKIKENVKDPLVEAKVRESVAQAYASLSARVEAQREVELALAIRKQLQGDEHPDTLHAMVMLGGLYIGRNAEAEALLTKVHETSLRKLGEDHTVTNESLIALAGIYELEKKFREEQAVLTKLYEVRLRTLGPENRQTLSAKMSMGASYFLIETQENLKKSQDVLNDVVKDTRRVLGESDRLTQTARTLLNTANTLSRLQAAKSPNDRADVANMLTDLAKSLPAYTSIPEMISRTIPEVQPLLLQEKYKEAADLVNSRMEIVHRAGADGDPTTNVLWMLLGRAQINLGKNADAKSSFLKSIDLLQKSTIQDPAALLTLKRLLAGTQRNLKEYPEAESLYRQILEASRQNPGDGNQQTRVDMGNLAATYHDAGKYKEAEETFELLRQAQSRYVGPETLNVQITASNIAWMRLRQKKYAEAESILRETAAILDRTAPTGWERANLQSLLGATLSAQGKFAEAEPLLLSGYNDTSQRQQVVQVGASLFTAVQAGEAIVDMYQRWGKPDQAADWRSKLQAPKSSAVQ